MFSLRYVTTVPARVAFSFWDDGQPDNWDYRESGEDCGQIHSSEKRKRKMWNDADCNIRYPYICETRV